MSTRITSLVLLAVLSTFAQSSFAAVTNVLYLADTTRIWSNWTDTAAHDADDSLGIPDIAFKPDSTVTVLTDDDGFNYLQSITIHYSSYSPTNTSAYQTLANSLRPGDLFFGTRDKDDSNLGVKSDTGETVNGDTTYESLKKTGSWEWIVHTSPWNRDDTASSTSDTHHDWKLYSVDPNDWSGDRNDFASIDASPYAMSQWPTGGVSIRSNHPYYAEYSALQQETLEDSEIGVDEFVVWGTGLSWKVDFVTSSNPNGLNLGAATGNEVLEVGFAVNCANDVLNSYVQLPEAPGSSGDVPEPSTLVIWSLLGAAGMGVAGRRRRRGRWSDDARQEIYRVVGRS